jgi:DNA-binding response OmpR family regulator
MKRVLTVDDSRAMRNIVAKALADLDVEILQAEDGQQGLDAVAANHPDLIVLDVTMPVMDGPTMLRELRSRGDKTPVILLTAESGTAIIGPMMAQGLDDYIVKPFKPEELQAKVKKILSPQGKVVAAPVLESEPAPRAEARTSAGSGGGFLATEGRPFVEILLIDDMENVAKQFRAQIPENLKINSATDGQTAAALCRERLYRVVIVDLEIPDVDSASLARQLRALQPSAAFVALIMRNVKNPLQVARDAGFEGALVKPFDPEQIGDFLTAYFETKDLVEVEGNVVKVAAFAGKKERELRYFARLSKLLDEAVDKLAAACYPSMVLDLSRVPPSPDQLLRLLSTSARYAKDMGIDLRLVAPQETRKIVADVVETASIPFFETVEDARA